MKKIINSIYALFSISLLTVLMACNGLVNNTIEKENSLTIAGSISSEESSARAATSSYFSEDVTWSISAVSKNDSNKTAEGSVEGVNFKIGLPFTGEWILTANGKVNDNVVLSGTEIVTVDKKGLSDVKIKIAPAESDEKGKVSLTFKDKSALVSKVIMSENGEDLASADFASGEATLTADDLSKGLHNMTFTFENAQGDILYSCTEAVTIFAGLSTDTWTGKSSYFVENEDGTTSFVITKSLFSINYGTPVMLYESQGEREGYKLTLSNNGFKETVVEKTAYDMDTGYDKPIDYCVDANGCVYILYYVKEDETETSNRIPIIYSNNPTFVNKTVTLLDNEYNPIAVTQLGYDSGTNKIYGLYNNKLYCFPSLITKGSISDYKTYSGVGDFYNFAIHNNILYLLKNDEGSYELYKKDLTQAESTLTISIDTSESSQDRIMEVSDFESEMEYRYKYEDPDSGTELLTTSESVSYSVIDMVYAEGYLNLLVNYSFPSLNNKFLNISGGGVLRVDTTTDGYEHEYVLLSSTKELEVIVNDEYGDPTDNTDIISVDQPDSLLSKDGFFCPSRIIGIKPKKLIIADDGVFMYTDSTGGHFKNANRVVTVDLDSYTITNVELVDEVFDGDLASLNEADTAYAGVFVCAD